jgi:hypothetical protein
LSVAQPRFDRAGFGFTATLARDADAFLRDTASFFAAFFFAAIFFAAGFAAGAAPAPSSCFTSVFGAIAR